MAESTQTKINREEAVAVADPQPLRLQAPPRGYFTCQVHRAGIGDVMQQLVTLYGIGVRHGLTYVHSPVKTHQCPEADFDSFLGLSLGELTIEQCKTRPQYDIDYRALKLGYLGRHAAHKTGMPFYRLNLGPKVYRLVHRCLHRGVMDRQFQEFRLADKYWKARSADPHDEVFPNTGRLRVAVHIRRGDCEGLERDGKFILPHLHAAVALDRFQWFSGLANVTSLLDAMIQEFGTNSFDICVCSDGYLPLATLGVDSAEIAESLIRSRCEMDVFNRYPNTRLCIGNAALETYRAIHAFASADVIIKRSNSCFPDLGARCHPLSRPVSIIHASSDREDSLQRISAVLSRRMSAGQN